MSEYPEHEKMKAVKDQADDLAPFLEWLEEQGYVICSYDPDRRNEWRPVFSGNEIEKAMAAYFGIDLTKIAEEKDAMLKQIRHDHDRDEAVKLRKEMSR